MSIDSLTNISTIGYRVAVVLSSIFKQYLVPGTRYRYMYEIDFFAE